MDAGRTVLVIVGTGDVTDVLMTRVLQQATGINSASGIAPLDCSVEAVPTGTRINSVQQLNIDVSLQFRAEANTYQYT